LPRYGIIYIGQKHNIWRYDFQEHTHQQITLEEIDYADNPFLDFVHDPYWPTTDDMISFSMESNALYINYQDTTHKIEIRDLHIPLTMTTTPEYLIQPTMN
jgi:hypothetical protein